MIMTNFPMMGTESDVMLMPFEEIVIRASMVKKQADADYLRAETDRKEAEQRMKRQSRKNR